MKPLFIGIAGGTGSGKSTIAARIAAALPPGCAAILDHDSYYNPYPGLSPDEREKLNFDHPAALDDARFLQHLDALKAGRGIDVPVYDFVTHLRRAESRRVEPVPIVMVEGILLLTDSRIRERLDVKLFVDTDADIRVFRRISRDMESRGRTFDQIREQYYATVRPMHLQFVEPSKRWADLIIPGGTDNAAVLGMVVEQCRDHLWRGRASAAQAAISRITP